MALEVGRAYVAVLPDLKGFAASLAGKMRAEGAAGAVLGGRSLGMAAGGAVVAGVVAGTAILAKQGAQWNDAFRTIRVETGETGKAFEGLKGSMKNVFTQTAAPMQDTAAAIAKVHQQLNLTGAPLEDLTLQILSLSRITGTDVASNTEAAAHAMNNWGIAGKDAGPVMDMLFRASQQSGLSFADLSGTLASNGAQFRAVGLDIGDAAAMLGVLAKSGLSASDAMPALQFAMKKAAKDGKDAKTVFQDTFAAIKNAPNDIVATQAAVETFGGRAGPKFAALIREGKISYEEFKASIASGDTIKAAADDVGGWSGQIDKFKHIIETALEPAATKAFQSIKSVIKGVKPVVEAFGVVLNVIATAVSKIPTPVFGVVAAFVALGGSILAVTKIFSGIQAVWSALSAAFALNPVVLALILIAAAAYVVWRNWDTIKEKVPAAWEAVKDATAKAWTWIKDFFAKFWPYLLGAIFGPIGLIVAYVATHWDQVKEKTGQAWDWIKNKVAQVWETIRTWISEKVAAIRDGISNGWNTIVERVRSAGETLKNVVLAPFRWIGDRAKDVVNAVGKIGDKFEGVRDAIGRAVGGIIGWITGFVDTAKTKLQELKDWIGRNLSNLLGPLAGPLGGLVRGVGGLFRASGGPVEAGRPVMVGEKGPEMVTFAQDANVLSTTSTRRLMASVLEGSGGGSGVTVNGPLVEISGDLAIRSDEDITALSRELAKDINRRARALGESVPLTGRVA